MHTYDPLSPAEVKECVAAVERFVHENPPMSYDEALVWVESQKQACQLKAVPKKVTVEDLMEAAGE